MDTDAYAYLAEAIEDDVPRLDEAAVRLIHQVITRRLSAEAVRPVEPFLARHREIAAVRDVPIEFWVDANKVVFLRLPAALTSDAVARRLTRLLGPTFCRRDRTEPETVRLTLRNPDIEAVRSALLAASFVESAPHP